MRVHVRKWGNSASVRLPAPVMAAASLRVDQLVEVREDGGRIVIEPVKPVQGELDALLAGMDPATFPDDADFGPPVGQEVW
jgi:antitoxin MazE